MSHERTGMIPFWILKFRGNWVPEFAHSLNYDGTSGMLTSNLFFVFFLEGFVPSGLSFWHFINQSK